MRASASWNAIPWFCPIGRPNTTRCFAYSVARRSAARPMPSAALPEITRSALSPARIALKPCPTSPITSSSATNRSSMNSSLVSTALRPILVIGRMSTLSRSSGAKNSVMPAVFFGDLARVAVVRHSRNIRSASCASRDPHLLPGDEVSAVDLAGERRDARGVGAGVGLGDRERHVQVAACGARQEPALQVLAAVLDHRLETEDADVHGRAAVHAGA